MLDGERLAPRRTCLEHTALVADAAARTVDVAQMDLDAGESGIESIDCPGQNLFEPFALCIGQRNVAVSVDEDLHQYLLRVLPAERAIQIGRASCRERVCQYV